MTKGYFEFEYLRRRDLNDEVQKVVQNYLNIYNSLAGTVNYFANLPSASENLDKIWLVRYATTVLGIITKQAGLYISNGTSWEWMTSLEAKADKNRLISAGNGLTGGGDLSVDRTISHSDTSSQANVVNTGGNVLQSANLDDFGHITSFSSIDLDNRYITTSGAYANPTWITSLGADKLTGTIPSNVLSGSTLYIGTTAIALNRASGNQALTGISSMQFTGATSGTSTLQAPAVAGTTTFTLPTTSGNLIGSNDTALTNWNTAYDRSPTALSVTGTTTKTITLTKQDGTTLTANWSDLNTDAVTSVFGRTGAVVATEGDYSLNLLSDVVITTPATNQLLRYNGTNWANWTANYLTGNQTITLSGDITGSGTTAITTALANSGVVAGTYQSATTITPLTIDAKGRITSVGAATTIAPAFSSITSKPTTIAGYGITDGVTLTETQTLTNKTFTDSTTFFQDNLDDTKKAQFELSNIATGTTRTYTLPNNNGVIVTDQQYTASDVLNKIKTVDGVGSGLDAGLLQGMSVSGAVAIGSSSWPTIVNIRSDGVAEVGRYLDFHPSSGDSNDHSARIDAGSTTTARVLTLPINSGTLISTGGTAVVSNAMLAQITAANKVADSATSATNVATANTIVRRDVNANFLANDVKFRAVYQGGSAFAAINTTSTLTIAQILTLVIESTPTANITFTLPTGTNTDAGVMSSLETFASFTWSIVNIATGFTITMAGNTGHTYIGNTTITANTSASFITQKTAANTFKTVRI